MVRLIGQRLLQAFSKGGARLSRDTIYEAKSCLEGLCYTSGHNFNEYLAHSGELEIVANQVTQLSGEGQALRLAVGRLGMLGSGEGGSLGSALPTIPAMC